MTNDEMERAIDFLLKSQANLEQRIEQVNENLGARIEETNRLLAEMAQTQNQFIQIVTRTFERQAQIDESLRAAQTRTEEALVRLAEAQAHTDRRLDALIDIVQRDHNGQ
ncbi:MAG: hypothetical protein M3444_02965 [Acidobacteriota bacterium]|nr:hypothetical protein [Acidobacteriota bacterium]MDQ5836508.1 hypothetical protein [Acidobacteriota bacterium]